MRILIVDDNISLAEGISELLSSDSHKVLVAVNGEDGLNELSRSSIDLALVDFQLPDMNAIDVYAKARKLNIDTRMVIVTGYRLEHLLATITHPEQIEIHFDLRIENLLARINQLNCNDLLVASFSDANQMTRVVNNIEKNQQICVLTDSSTIEDLPRGADLILVHVTHSLLSALGLCKVIKAEGVDTPIAMLLKTEESLHNDYSLRALTALDCLFKPFEFDDLTNLVSEAEVIAV
ncbi:MAG: response regulator [Gammaproteobacteria bacterium]|nr:response regulator [Gammaproteobacteria bacterium]MDH5729374.1 response regulator [Gammaproteobacteria bacterium]